ncbi:UDP-4-amino-4,6-dideoxy-N-acetyl-beta-L-altrosamine transaminase [Gracilibacillus timonensis]|uniref:UDP-4-amino-4, 6-dideoxy-N-acetyl-beta-L-altrosamine transaminase n=1 Tax=Gracilibacillus timonensis TaxID=1816696 RepID=UPI0008246507|nr:UDP-4-amino-4,6-dideoxy-N-acetyl-beta-L-altrosamine transaminase [Gracilibacillus timonensis]
MSDHSFIPYGKQSLDEEDIQAVVNVLRSDYLTTGPAINQFEEAIAAYVDSKYAVAFSSGTAALHGACFAAGITEGDEVITTPMTFVASSNCVLYQGGTPIFADIDPVTYNINPLEIEKKITNKTKAIIPVDFTGQPCELEEIIEIARRHKLIVIEDAAHALGATYRGQKIGSISDMTMFSFHPVKHITTGEGGVITTNNKVYYEKLLAFRSHGITRDRSQMMDDHGPWYYEMQFLGYNYRMTDIQAALGISQLRKSDQFLERRKEIVEKYNWHFKDIKEVVIPKQSAFVESSWHIYVLRFCSNVLQVSKAKLFNELRNCDIGVNVHYIPVHKQPYYKNLGYNQCNYLEAEHLYEEAITLPLFPSMTDQEVEYIIQTIKRIISTNKRTKVGDEE